MPAPTASPPATAVSTDRSSTNSADRNVGLKRGLGPVKAVRDAPETDRRALSPPDVIALRRVAVELTGGPKIEPRWVADTTVADPENRMPSESLDGDETRGTSPRRFGAGRWWPRPRTIGEGIRRAVQLR